MPTTTTFARRRNAVALISGTLSVLIGLTVLAGYATRNAWLITFLPDSAPMRLTTAAAILCCGAAVLLLAGGFFKAAAAIAAFCGLIGALQFFEAFAGFRISGLDAIAFAAQVPPRAGMLAACMLMLAAAALVLMSGVVRPRSRLALVGFSGSVLHSIGVVAVFSYLAGVSSAFSAGAFSQLAIHTAVAMAAIGAALIRFAWRDSVTAATGAPAWLPLLIGAGTLATTFCLYGAMTADHKSDFDQQVAFEAEGLRQFIHAGLDNRIQPLIRMARHRAVADLKKDEWDADAQMILTRGGYQAIEWIDPAGRLLWTTPPGAGDATPDGNAVFEPRRRAAFEAARQNQEVAATRPVDLVTGGKGMIVVVPVFARGELAGYVAGVFRYQLLFQNLLSSNPSPRYSIAVRDGSERVFAQGTPGGSAGQLRSTDLTGGGVLWTLEIGPTKSLVLQARTPVGEILLVGGGFLAVVLTLLTHLLRRAGTRQIFDAAAPAAGVPLTDAVPVITYSCGGAALAWNESAKRLFEGAPPGIPACASGFRTLHATLLCATASPGSLDALRLLLDSCVQPALVFDAEGRFIAANAASEGTLAWADAAWRGKSIGTGGGREPLEIQNVLLMQGDWATPASASARAATAS